MKFFMYLTSVWFSFNVSTPFQGASYRKWIAQNPDYREVQVVLAITNAILHEDSNDRDEFAKQTQLVYGALEGRPGFIAGSIRKTVLGNEVWTVSLWENRQALTDFLQSREHINAMVMADTAIDLIRSKVITDQFKNIHLNWDAFEKMIALTPFKKYKPI